MAEDEDKKLQAEYCLKLADRASNRIQSRRTVEWQVALGLWTAFGAGAGFVLTSKSWVSGIWPAILGTLLAVIVIMVFYWSWLGYMRTVTEQDQKRSVIWEAEVITLLKLPPDPSAPADAKQFVWKGLHKAQWMQLVVAILFALLFVGALWIRCGSSATTENQPSRIVVEGGSLEMVSPSEKLKLGK